MTVDHQAYLESPYLDRDGAQGQWEQRSDLLRTVRAKMVEHLADMIDCELHTRIEYRDILSLRTKLGEWLDSVHDGELEDRVAVELDLLLDWERPTY